jgi:multimeric flavodoxin WrbA
MAGQALRAADILVFRPPTWMGHMSSIAQRALERLDAELSLMDDQGRPEIYDKVAVVALVGNEDGAHAIIADVFQGLNDGTTRTLGTCPQRSPPPPPPHSPPRPPMSHRC